MAHDLAYLIAISHVVATSVSSLWLFLFPRRYSNRCRLRRRTRNLWCGLSQPGFEPGLAETCVIVRNERPLAHLDAVVPPMRVGDHLARILVRVEKPPGEFIEAKLFWPPQFQLCNSRVGRS